MKPGRVWWRRKGSALAWVIALLLAGCGSEQGACTPGASVACACPDGRVGAQVCTDDHRFATCVCLGAPDSSTPDVAVTDGPTRDDAGPSDRGLPDDASDAVADGAPDASIDAGDAARADAGAHDAAGGDGSTLDAAPSDAPLGVDAAPDGAGADVAASDVSSGSAMRLSGSFVSGVTGLGGVTLRGRLGWHGSVRMTGGGITLEGRFE